MNTDEILCGSCMVLPENNPSELQEDQEDFSGPGGPNLPEKDPEQAKTELKTDVHEIYMEHYGDEYRSRWEKLSPKEGSP